MSRARDALRKEKLQKRIEYGLADGSLTPDDVKERHRVKRLIKQGVLPRFNLVKDENGKLPKHKIKRWVMNIKTNQVEPVVGGCALVQVSTMGILCKKIPQIPE